MKLCDKIRWARKQRGWSIGYMRKRTSFSFERICEIEGGKPVKMSELVKIAEALKRDVSFFLTDDEPTAELVLWCKDKTDYRQAVDCAPGFLGDEKPEDVIRRARGG